MLAPLPPGKPRGELLPDTSDISYEDSTIDWDRLRSFAKRVARESKRPRPTTTVRGVEQTQEVKRGLFGGTKVVRGTRPFERLEQVDYWVLDHRYYRRQRRVDARNTDTEVMLFDCCLHTDGRLMLRTDSYDEFEGPTYRNHYEESTHSHSEVAFVNAQVELFDFEMGSHSVRGDLKIDTNNVAGKRRIAFARGVGLSLKLKAMLDPK